MTPFNLQTQYSTPAHIVQLLLISGIFAVFPVYGDDCEGGGIDYYYKCDDRTVESCDEHFDPNSATFIHEESGTCINPQSKELCQYTYYSLKSTVYVINEDVTCPSCSAKYSLSGGEGGGTDDQDPSGCLSGKHGKGINIGYSGGLIMGGVLSGTVIISVFVTSAGCVYYKLHRHNYSPLAPSP